MLPDLDPLLEKRRVVAPGEMIFFEHDRADCAYVVLKGEVQIVAGTGGRAPTLINRIPPGEMFGELALLQDDLRTASAMSKDGCELLILDKALFVEKLTGADPFLRYVVDHLCNLILIWTDRATRREKIAPGPRS
jgi:CRP/FNR family cyclic AMP-dependent transcriptional regulator